MLELTISRQETSEPGLDQQQLFERGLEHVRQLARRIWTDHNTHDPGITTLELLCYALTDLSYRASLPLEDLLATEADNAGNMARQFFTPRQALPMRPLTVLDYRKLLIDLPGVKNAWVKPRPVTYYADTAAARLRRDKPPQPGIRDVHVRGVYQVLIDFMDGVTSEGQAQVLQAVRQRLHANRNLCEDFAEVSGVEPQWFNLCGELELSPEADAARVKAEVLFRVRQYLSPPVSSYSLSEMLERRKPDGSRYSAPELFEGPPLDCGFIDDEELARAELRTEVRLSDLISIVMDVEGVRAVRDLLITPRDTPGPVANRWLVPVASGRRATLDDQRSRLVFYKRNMPLLPPAAQVDTHLAALAEQARVKLETPQEYDLPIPLGRARRPERYYSVQNHFPALYGLGEQGLPSGASDARRAQAWQLKAWLLFFDQVMANYCVQLSQVRQLFSTDPELHQTYFYQVVDSFSDFERIYSSPEAVKTLEAQAADEATLEARRGRFLEHLLSRFAERFHEYAAIMASRFGATPRSLVRVQCEFLARQPTLGAERGLAYDASLTDASALWDSDNVSGLERRLASLLGIPNPSRRNLSDITFDIYAEVDSTPGDEFRFRVLHRETRKILLSSSTRYTTPEAAREEMKRALHFAQLPSGYQRKLTEDGRHYFNIVDDTGEVLARRIEYFGSEALMEAAIDDLLAYVGEHYSREGMFLIENLLLRPEQAEDPFLPICVDPNCTDCADDDPYSYRLHIVLPAYAGRFLDMDFRRFVEEVIRQETPAHLLPKVCWVSSDDMARLEKAYRPWLELRAGVSTEGRQQKLQALIDALYTVKNVYPVQRLTECDSGEERPRFIVGRGALGSGVKGGAA